MSISGEREIIIQTIEGIGAGIYVTYPSLQPDVIARNLLKQLVVQFHFRDQPTIIFPVDKSRVLALSSHEQ